MEEIIFTGPLDDIKKTELLHILDVNLAPSSFEGYGLIFIEPEYCGVPTVTYDHTSNSEVVSDGGIIVPFGDIDKLVESTITLIENSELRREIGFKATEIIKSRNLPIHWCSAIENVISENFISKDNNGKIITIQPKRPKKLTVFVKFKIIYLKSVNANMRMCIISIKDM